MVYPASNPDIKDEKPYERTTKVIQEFRDVFKNELPGRPPERTIAHVMDTEEGTPISRPPYKMSPRELYELKRQLEEPNESRIDQTKLLFLGCSSSFC